MQPGRVPQLTVIKNSMIAGHPWTIEYQTTPAFEKASDVALLYWIPPLGLAVTLLLTMLSWLQARAAGSLAVQTAQLQRREFEQRLLAEAGALLNQSLEYEKTLASVVELVVPEFADWAAVDIADEEGKIRRLAITHVQPDKVRWARELQEKYPPDPNAPTGVPHVIRTGESELYEQLTSEMLRPRARDEEMWQIIQQIGFSSGMVVPITTRGRVLGALSFVWAESGRHYDKEDLELAKQLGLRAGVAVDNAILYQQAERERVEVSRLNTNLERLVSERTSDLETVVSELEAFSYSVSHDLRAPLRAVDGFSRSLLDDYSSHLDETATGYIGRIRSAAKRMDELISALLSLSRITRTEVVRREIDVTHLAREAAADAKAAFGADVEVVVQEGLTAKADSHLLQIALDNLVGNAVKFSAQKPHAKVEVGVSEGVFFVRDNGVGFNPEYSSKLFAPFERLHSVREYPGSGIGLATVQRIIARHGGRIWAESKEGEGATFYFTLP
jgi:signal transduction histidine kinase